MTGQIAKNEQQPEAKASGKLPLKNPRFEKLSREYAAGASMSAAWRAAYGSDPATGNPTRTFARPEVQARIEHLRAEFNRMAGISLGALQARLLRIADANVVDLLETEGGTLRLRNLQALPAAAKAAVSEIEVGDDGAIKVKTTKTADRLHAIDSLLKTVGGFAPDDVNVASQNVIYSIVTGVPESEYDRAKRAAEARAIQDSAPPDHQTRSLRRVRL